MGVLLSRSSKKPENRAMTPKAVTLRSAKIRPRGTSCRAAPLVRRFTNCGSNARKNAPHEAYSGHRGAAATSSGATTSAGQHVRHTDVLDLQEDEPQAK